MSVGSYWFPIQQRDALLTLRNSSIFSLWKPLDQILNKTDRVTLPDLAELNSDMTIDALVEELNDLQRPEKHKFTTGFWQYFQYALTSLALMGLILLVLWFKFGLRKLSCKVCMAAMGNRKIRQADKNRKAGQEEDEEIIAVNTGSVDSQPREVRREPADMRSAGSFMLELETPKSG